MFSCLLCVAFAEELPLADFEANCVGWNDGLLGGLLDRTSTTPGANLRFTKRRSGHTSDSRSW